MKLFYLFLIGLLCSACTNTNTNTNNNTTKTDVPAKEILESTETVEAKTDNLPEILDTKKKENRDFFDFLLSNNESEISGTNAEKLYTLFEIDEMFRDKYTLYKLSEDKAFIYLLKGRMCSATTCVGTNLLALFDKENGLQDKISISYETDEMEMDTKVVGKTIFYTHHKCPIYKSNAANPRGVELETYKDVVQIYWIQDNKIIDLTEADKKTLRRARNLFFARKGYRFKDENLQDYFNQFDWYKPSTDNADNLLDEDEKVVVTAIKEIEDNL